MGAAPVRQATDRSPVLWNLVTSVPWAVGEWDEASEYDLELAAQRAHKHMQEQHEGRI